MSVERGTYVLCSSLMLMVLFWQSRQMPAVIWNIAEMFCDECRRYRERISMLLPWRKRNPITFNCP